MNWFGLLTAASSIPIAAKLGALLDARARSIVFGPLVRREAFRQRRWSCVLLDTVQACLCVLTGPHQDFLVGREIVMTVTPDGGEILGAA